MRQPVMENEPILLREDEDGIATLTLNRPQAYNTLTVEMLSELQRALEALASDRSVRVVVIAGSGRAFCAGHDLKQMRANDSAEAHKALFKQCSDVMLAINGLPQPVIARVHGMAVAAGCQLVATCDLAVASKEARFATSGINVGLFCSTPAVALSRAVPRKAALEMLFTGELVDADTAAQIGLVNRVVPAAALDDTVAKLARAIAAKSPFAVALGKEAFYRQIDLDLEAAYTFASERMVCNMLAEDTADGIDAFIEKRPPPDWKGR